MKILNNKKYKFHCYECSSDILFSKEDCLVDRTYGDFWLNCPVCGREYDNQTYKIFRYEYIEEYDDDDKDKEIERLNSKVEELMTLYTTEREVKEDYKSIIKEVREYIEKDTRWFDSEYAKTYGELCTCAGANDTRLEVLVNPSNLLKILDKTN